MSTPFSRSIRSTSASTFGGSLFAILMVASVLGMWAVWFCRAQISIYEMSDIARLEVEQAVHAIQAHVSGRIARNYLVLGERVEAGQLLAELDADSEQLRLKEQQTKSLALRSQLAALGKEVAAASEAIDAARDTARVALDEARAQFSEADVAARYARLAAEKFAPLHASGDISTLEFARIKTEANKLDATAEGKRLAVNRWEQQYRTAGRDRQAQLERLKGEIKRIEGEMLMEQATIKRMESEVDKRRIYASVTGFIGEVGGQRPGTFVNEGSKMGAIIPEGGLKIVAYFSPQAALGRVHAGQPARLRLEGFPWSQHGTLAAKVTTVAGEPAEGRVRVELQLQPDQTFSVPLQHGLLGTIEVEVGRVSPLMLVLQSLERVLTTTESARK